MPKTVSPSISSRAIGLLRMKDRMDKDKTATKLQVAALHKMIAEIPDDVLDEARQYVAQHPADTQPKAATQPGPKITMGATKKAPDQMTFKSDDLASLLSGSPSSSFQKVYDAFCDYEAAQDPDKKQKHLQTLERRASRWVNEHTDSVRGLDLARREALEKLVDQVAVEQARLSRAGAEARYMGNIGKSGKNANYQSKDPDERHAFKALTPGSMGDVNRVVVRKEMPIVNKHGLTDAEIAAIRIFTGDDYGYINPATANSPQWLEDNKANVMTSVGFSRGGATDSDRMSEGVVHVGVAVSGLRKIPAYSGDVYRGVSANQANIDEWKAKGLRFDALASATTKRSTAEDFASSNRTAAKPIQVIFVIHNAGGRDIKDISAKAKEDEVTILPGSSYRVIAVNDLPDSLGGPVREIEVSP
jgi:hypothetical protein